MPYYKEINTADVVPNIHQPRTVFNDASINQLALSIQENGLLQPITVRKTDNGYQLIAGERRFRACQLLQREKIEAFIIEANDLESAQLAIIENIQREDLSPIEEAKAYREMLNLTDMTQTELAVQMGKTQSSIANKLRLLNLCEEVIDAIENKEITERHGRALLSLEPEKQIKALNYIENKNLNVKQSEDYIQTLQTKKESKKKKRCFGVSPLLIIRSFTDTFKKCHELTDKVTMEKQETSDSYIITITIKK